MTSAKPVMPVVGAAGAVRHLEELPGFVIIDAGGEVFEPGID